MLRCQLNTMLHFALRWLDDLCSLELVALPPEQLQIVKQEFNRMLELSSHQPSTNTWSSARHVALKETVDWRECGDYCALNKVAVPDRYRVPHIQDFAVALRGATMFTKINLVKAYQAYKEHTKDSYHHPIWHCTNTFVCHLASEMLLRCLNGSLTKGCVDCHFVLYTSTTL